MAGSEPPSRKGTTYRVPISLANVMP